MIMKLIIDIPEQFYEQIQKYPKGLWISRDMIKPLQEELEEIKKKIENYDEYYLMEDDYFDGVRFGLRLGYQEVEKAIKELNYEIL